MRLRFRAPATSANMGPGFDCLATAFTIYNEVEVSDEGGPAPDPDHLALQAFVRLHPLDGYSFSFTARIPRERGLGSSAATIALGLVAGAWLAGRGGMSAEELLAIGLDLEGHPDNLAAALCGGVCLTWDGNVTRIAADLPAKAIAIIPPQRTATKESRAALPDTVSHADAVFNATQAALLGAALGSRSSQLFAAALQDRLHEPYRPSPLLDAIRADLPAGVLGATLSGSGPTVIAWAQRATPVLAEAELKSRFPDCEIVGLTVAGRGAAKFDL